MENQGRGGGRGVGRSGNFGLSGHGGEPALNEMGLWKLAACKCNHPVRGFTMPLWVQVLQALTVPVIAAVGAWVALQQMYIARVKLQHDLYDRRSAVFEAVRQFLNEAISQKIVSTETFRSFALRTADAPFLFDDRLAAYLKEMRDHGANAQSIYSVIESGEGIMPPDQKARASEEAGKHLMWLVGQIDRIAEKFRPFLTLNKRSRSPLRLWSWP